MKRGELFEAALALLLIFMLFLLYLAVTTGAGVSEEWSISGPASNTSFQVYDNMFAPGNGTLYTIDGSNVSAIDADGSVIWKQPIPDMFKINANGEKWTGIDGAADGGNFYVMVGPGNEPQRGELLSYSSNGTLRWGVPTSFDYRGSAPYASYVSYPGLQAKNGRIYLHHQRNEVLMDENGTILLNLYGVYDPASVDERGNMYVFSKDEGAIEAYDRDGALIWRHGAGEYNVTMASGQQVAQPYYGDGMLYVWLDRGVMALDMNGSRLWDRQYKDDEVIADFYTPVDDENNVYLAHFNYGGSPYMSMIYKNGSEALPQNGTLMLDPASMLGASGGICYYVQRIAPNGVADTPNTRQYEDYYSIEYEMTREGGHRNDTRSLDMLDMYRIQAVDLNAGRVLWEYDLPLFPVNVTVDSSNVGSVMPYMDTSQVFKDNTVKPDTWYKDNGVPNGTIAIGSNGRVNILAGKGMIYVSQWTYNYEVPTFYGQSHSIYSSGIYALDKDGKLLWAHPTGSRVTSMKEANGTIYYGTDDGKLSATKVSAAAGFVITAAFYLFIRFFLAGAVTRARSRINSNENRRNVLQFIVEQPGASLYEISRGLKMNVGTIRYHLLILSLNHRIVSYKADQKSIRYFTNSGSFRDEEQFIISLLRRDAIGKMIPLLMANPGLSNRELSRALDMQDSATNRYMKELLAGGIVDREQKTDGRTAYAIRAEYRAPIARAMQRLNWRDPL